MNSYTKQGSFVEIHLDKMKTVERVLDTNFHQQISLFGGIKGMNHDQKGIMNISEEKQFI